MKRFVWLTDLHLNFPGRESVPEFINRVAEVASDGVLLTGDISEWPDCPRYLGQMAERIERPIYFVLGNHDYYFSSIDTIRRFMLRLCDEVPELVWLTAKNVIELTPRVGLVGHDGWSDGRFGDYVNSRVLLNDYRLIAELAGLDKWKRLDRLHALGDEAAEHARSVLPEALLTYEHVVFLTHPPPFREACWYNGRISDDDWLPHFTCQALGEALRQIMATHAERQLTVLCGHTHGEGVAEIMPNLRVYTGGAVYGAPQIQRVFEWE